MVLFKALNKSCTDLLQRNYVHEKNWQVDLSQRGQNPVFSHTASVSPSGSLTAASSISHVEPWGLVKYNFGSSSMQGDVSYKFKHLPGMMFSGHAERMHLAEKGEGHKITADISLEYNGEEGAVKKNQALSLLTPHIKLTMDPILTKWVASGTSRIALGGNCAVHIGAEATGLSDFKAVKYAAGMTFSQTAHQKSWVASLVGYPQDGQLFGKIVGGVYCRSTTPGSPEVAAEVTYFTTPKPPTVTFGGQWYLNQPQEGAKTDTTLKLKLTQDAKIAASFTHKLSDLVTATIGTQIDALAPENAKCGVALQISA